MTDLTIKGINQNALAEEIVKNQPVDAPVCKYCGQKYISKAITFGGKTINVWAVPCNCYDKAQIEAENKKRREKLVEKYQIANIGERYASITLEKLAQMGTENVQQAQKYVDNFNPISGKSLHFIGEFGNGKTSVGYSIVKSLIAKGFNCLSTSWNEFSLRCHYAKSYDTKETIEQILSDISKFDFVMIDEFCPNCKDEKEIILATEMIDRLYRNNKSFLIINNPCDIQAMKQVPRFGKALDRIREQSEKLIFRHESYRK